jgi:hypothetical protein
VIAKAVMELALETILGLEEEYGIVLLAHPEPLGLSLHISEGEPHAAEKLVVWRREQEALQQRPDILAAMISILLERQYQAICRS